MSFTLQWYLQDYILYVVFSGQVTLDEIDTYSSQTSEILQAQRHPIFFLVEFRNLTDYPTSLQKLSESFRVFRHQKYAGAFCWGGNRITGLLVSSLGFLLRKPIRHYDSQEQAIRSLQNHVPNLDLSRPDYRILPETGPLHDRSAEDA